MFNGIIKNTGIIKKIYKKNNNCMVHIKTNMNFNKNEIGSSISTSGVCLTLNSFKNRIIKFYVSKETLNRTTFKNLKIGNFVNLEKSLKFGERISGHFVQGHVDTTSAVKNISYVGKSWIIKFALPKKYLNYLIYKGSISVNGVSLTVSRVLKNGFEISVIPQTLQLTNLIYLKKNDRVNIEFDLMGKYIKKIFKR
tara:strand:- start:2632 stop:3219 length:588 start_codon:yes stop_codon:yes gene_type:complete